MNGKYIKIPQPDQTNLYLCQMHKAGFVNIVGSPNVGKSTLMNVFMNEKFSIITSKAQTTRHRILGIVNNQDYQIIFSDTPGIILPEYALQNSMMDAAKSAFTDADVLVYMVEMGEKSLADKALYERIKNRSNNVLLVINKIDLGDQESLNEQVDYWSKALPNADIWCVSALEKFKIDELRDHIVQLLPPHPPYFPKDQITDKPERFFVNECIREKILLHYQKEIPYAVEVMTEQFQESNDIIRIRTLIVVERASQKGIIIGHQGSAIKRVGIEARKDLELFFDKKIHLELFVKINKDWRSNAQQLKRFGY